MTLKQATIDPFSRPAVMCSKLKEGDIIRCKIPTDYNRDGDVKDIFRYSVVLGVRINKDTCMTSHVYVMRCAYKTLSFDNNTDIKLASNEYSVGKNTSSEISVKTKRIDMVPVMKDFFKNGAVEKVGEIHPRAFQKLQQAIDLGQKSQNDSERNVFPDPVVKSWVVPDLMCENLNDGKGVLAAEYLPWHMPSDKDIELIHENLFLDTSAEDFTEDNSNEDEQNRDFDMSCLAKPRKTKAQRRATRKANTANAYKKAMRYG